MDRRALSSLPILMLVACGEPEPAQDAATDSGRTDTGVAVDDRSNEPEDTGSEIDARSGEDASVSIDAPNVTPTDSGIMDARGIDVRVTDARVTDARVTDTGVDVRAADTATTMAVPLPRDVMPGASCRALLDRIGVRYTVSGPLMGVVDPVRVTPPINGVNLRYASYTASVNPMVMDCRLAVALFHLTRELRTRWDVTDVVHLGVYNYRTIAGSTMLSQHAYAMAIDIANLRTSNGTTHSVLNDFVANGRPTCPPRATNARDRLLKEVACWMHDSRVFHIVLTPNFNAAHRDHYHVDLTVGGNTIALELPAMMDPDPGSPFAWMIDDH